MLEQKALVKEVFHGSVELEYEINSSCSGCASENSCGVGTVAKAFSGKTQRIKVSTNNILSVGQWVTIGTKEANILAASAITYLLPLFGLLIGGILGQKWLVELLEMPSLSAVGTAVVTAIFSQQLGKYWLNNNQDLSPSIVIISPRFS